MVMTRQMGEFERWASGLASTAVGSWGMRRGGIIGLVALAGAGFLAWRAGTGRSLLTEGNQKLLAKVVPALAGDTEAPARKTASRRAPVKARSAAKGRSATGSRSATKAPAAAEATSRRSTRPAKGTAKPDQAPARVVSAAKRGAAEKTAASTAAAKADAPKAPAGKAMKKPVAARRNSPAHRATPANSGSEAGAKTIN